MISEVKIMPGYEDYECDIFGNVWSLKFGKRREMKPFKTKKGYLRIGLQNKGKIKKFLIHRLVMLTFHGKSELQVNHIDGNKKNNNFLNLEYCTSSENVIHAIDSGLKNDKGENHNSSKLTKKQVVEIKTNLKNNYYLGMVRDLAIKYGVSPQAISGIKTGARWSHIIID